MSRSANILVGDARARLREIPAGSVQCCVTSPPYWGLRDYGVDGQLGLERTPNEYVANMVDVFREVRRVLRDDGTLWLNLGDSYAAGKCGRDDQDEESLRRRFADYGTGRPKAGRTGNNGKPRDVPEGLKPKDLVGTPWRVAFALQADGWRLRSDIVWSKPNPMPESVTDRPTKAHEYLFLLSKSATYFYDADAIAEDAASFGRQHVSGVQSPKTRAYAETGLHGHGGDLGINYERESRNRRTVWTIATQPFPGAHFAVMPEALVEPCVLAGSKHGDLVLDPFAGAGTVGVVALKHGRSFVGVELNPKYAAMARNRIHDDAPLLNRALVSGGEAA